MALSVSEPEPSLVNPPSLRTPLSSGWAIVTANPLSLMIAPLASTLAAWSSTVIVLAAAAASVPPLKLKMPVPAVCEICGTVNVPPLRL